MSPPGLQLPQDIKRAPNISAHSYPKTMESAGKTDGLIVNDVSRWET